MPSESKFFLCIFEMGIYEHNRTETRRVKEWFRLRLQ